MPYDGPEWGPPDIRDCLEARAARLADRVFSAWVGLLSAEVVDECVPEELGAGLLLTTRGPHCMPTLTGEMRRAPIGNTPFDDPGGVDKDIGWGACLDQFLDEVAVARVLAGIDAPRIGHEDFENER
eukprot:8811040-Alexandrium_andersonii.AAC.1